jgi:uncharacterized protein YecE (DUF72 family)
VLVQFPISFKSTPENRQYVGNLRQRFREYPLVLEIRDSSWNDPHALEMLTELGIGFCNIDQPRIGQSLRATAEATRRSDTSGCTGAIIRTGLPRTGR